MSKYTLPPMNIPNRPQPLTKAEKEEYVNLCNQLSGKQFESKSAMEAFKEFAPEYARYQELHERLERIGMFEGGFRYFAFRN